LSKLTALPWKPESSNAGLLFSVSYLQFVAESTILSSSINGNCLSSFLGIQMSSLSRKAIKSPPADRTPVFRAALAPALDCLTSVTSDPNSDVMDWQVSSVEPSSTTIIWSGGWVWASTLLIARLTSLQRLKVGITTDSFGTLLFLSGLTFFNRTTCLSVEQPLNLFAHTKQWSRSWIDVLQIFAMLRRDKKSGEVDVIH